jgi:hypothetical protein
VRFRAPSTYNAPFIQQGFYKPMGISGDTLREALLALRPEIYGNIAEEKVELNGLLYVIERLPID